MSCQKSNKALLDKYRDVCQEFVTAASKGDMTEIAKISDKIMKLEKEIQESDLTAEEKAEFEKIQLEAATSATEAAMKGMENAVNSLDGALDDKSVEDALDKATEELEKNLNDIEKISDEINDTDN